VEKKMPELTLNDEQYEFMAGHHETVEVGVVMYEIFHIDAVIRGLEKNEEYCNLMGDMLWDDIYDRYECHPKYNPSFRRKLQQQFLNLGFHK
jgi:hypothetical protein